MDLKQLIEDITIVKETNLRGIHNGNATVCNNGVLIINGILNGNVTIEEHAEVIVWGTVVGNIINKGTCRIAGSIQGQLIEKGGRFVIDKNASVKN